MKEIELKPGWLKRQMEAAKAEVATWPPIFQALGTINDGLKVTAKDGKDTAKLRQEASDATSDTRSEK